MSEFIANRHCEGCGIQVDHPMDLRDWGDMQVCPTCFRQMKEEQEKREKNSKK